jgi:hypothetical protein
MAWQCALDVGFKNAISYAIATFPSMELIAKVLLKEYSALQEIAHSNNGVAPMEQHYSGYHQEYTDQQ